MSVTRESADWLHLRDDERVSWANRPHPVALGTRFVASLAVAVAGLLATGWAWIADYHLVGWFTLLVAVVSLASAAVAYAFWTNTRYVITSQQLYAKRGVLSRNVTQLSLEQVQNTTLRQSVAGRLLGYGDIAVYTAGSDAPEVTFTRAPNPSRARDALATQLGRLENENRH